jgi:4,5-dihydroxyphthalate decarboxylase
MADLKLNLVVGRHAGRFQALFDGRVKPERIELNASEMPLDELFWRVPNVDDFDIAELSLTGYMWGIQHGKRWIAIPVFPGWVFACHTETLCNADSGIDRPEDLKGKRVGVPEYPVTAITWIRYALETKYGVRPQDIHWYEERTLNTAITGHRATLPRTTSRWTSFRGKNACATC